MKRRWGRSPTMGSVMILYLIKKKTLKMISMMDRLRFLKLRIFQLKLQILNLSISQNQILQVKDLLLMQTSKVATLSLSLRLTSQVRKVILQQSLYQLSLNSPTNLVRRLTSTTENSHRYKLQNQWEMVKLQNREKLTKNPAI